MADNMPFQRVRPRQEIACKSWTYPIFPDKAFVLWELNAVLFTYLHCDSGFFSRSEKPFINASTLPFSNGRSVAERNNAVRDTKSS